MKNGQSAANELSNEQVQVLLTGKFGDGCLHANGKISRERGNCNFMYSTNCKYEEYLKWKKDGREFWYLRIRKYEGAFTITEILNKYPINCYNYKLISSETIRKGVGTKWYRKAQTVLN